MKCEICEFRPRTHSDWNRHLQVAHQIGQKEYEIASRAIRDAKRDLTGMSIVESAMRKSGLLALIVSMALAFGGCTKQIDRLTGGGGDTNDQTCAKYPWLCSEASPQGYHYSDEFCQGHPSLDVCGGNQGGFRSQP